jgi:hypothetical protein
MSGSTIGGVVGGVIGFFFGAPQLGYFLGSAIGGAIDPEEIRTPSIGDAQRQTSQPGVPRPVVYGHPAPFMGNIIDGEKIARKIESTEGGKGGPEVTSERFILTSAVRICEGPIAGILKIWRNDQLVFDRTADADFPAWSGSSLAERAAYAAAIRAKTTAFNGSIALYFGDETQLPDPTLEALHGVGNTPYYRGTAYMVIRDDDVTDMRGAAALWKFEVLSSATEGAAPTTTPNFSPSPQVTVGGGTAGTLQQTSVNRTIVGPLVLAAPYWGVSGFMAPVRVQVSFASRILFDSGWMGIEAYESAMNTSLSSTGNGNLVGPVSPDFPPTPQQFIAPNTSVSVVVTVFRWGPAGDSSSGGITMAYPDPALLPASVSISPEVPGALLGSDGNLYWPAWSTPTSLPDLTPDAVTLASVVIDICERCNVSSANLDVSQIAAEVIPGFLVAQQVTGAGCLLPTQQGFFYDFPEYDLKLRAISRGAAAVVSVTDDDLLEGEDQTRPQEVEYPRLVSVVTQDPAASYATIPQTSIRTSLEVQATSEVTLPLAIPFGADESKQIAEKLHKVLWSQAEGRIELSLPEAFSRLVPSDCINYANRRWLIESTNYADGEMNIRASYDRASNYSSSATGQPAAPPALPNSGLAGVTVMEFLNLPILSDLDDRLGFYVAVSGTTDGWRGAIIQARVGSSSTWTDLTTITSASVMGSLLTVLPNALADVTDDYNVVRVDVNGELSSITLEQLLNEGNASVVGDEIIQFMTATLISPGVYDLSYLPRGRLETTPALHAIGDRFVLLNAPVFIEAPSSWIGQPLQLRAVTLGTVADNNPVVTVTWSPARSQAEWVPVQFIGTRDASNNVAISWVGQGRLGSNMNAVNSQHFDRYQITITKGSASKVYTTTSQNFPYSAAQQTIDFGSATGTLSISIVAMNRITGAGPALTGSIP